MAGEFNNFQKAYVARTVGNHAYINGDYYEAMCFYNKSLILANKSELKELMALVYANRSAVYLKFKQYEKCLENIELARTNGYPADKLKKLKDRERKCHEMILQQQHQDPDDGPKDFFKLSYPANEKIPFIVDCLEIRDGEKQKRGIYTKQDLKAGDIVAIEDPIFTFLRYNASQCATCTKMNMLNLIPGDEEKMFCSTNCLNEYSRIAALYLDLPKDLYRDGLFKKALIISGGFEEIHEIYSDSTKRTVFDFDLNQPDESQTKINMLKCFSSLEKYQFNTTEVSKDLQAHISSYAESVKSTSIPSRYKKIVTELGYRNLLITARNNIWFKQVNCAVPVFLPLINHSCDPNIDINHASGSLVATINRPLKAGDQLFKTICSFDKAPKIERMTVSMEIQGFQCDCSACTKDYPMLEELPVMDPDFMMPTNRFGNVKETKAELQKNWKYLTDNMKHHPSFETLTLLCRNSDLLVRMENLVDCPFKRT